MSGTDLYCALAYPPCRAVFLVAAAINVDFNLLIVNLVDKVDVHSEYKKLFRSSGDPKIRGGFLPFLLGSSDGSMMRQMTLSANHQKLKQHNPSQIIPTLVEKDGFVLWEPGAIVRYLINKYRPDSVLYPMDARKRAVIDSRIEFNFATLLPNFENVLYPYLLHGYRDKEVWNKFDESMKILNNFFMSGDSYVTGPDLTIADLCLVATVSSIEIANFTLAQYDGVELWLSNLKSSLVYQDEENKYAINEYKNVIRELTGNKTLTRVMQEPSSFVDLSRRQSNVNGGVGL